VTLPNPLRIATRRSPLALWQARHVATALQRATPGLDVELVPLSTRGDEILDRSLATIGGKGLFLKELEIALQERRADIAVHSMKDVPAALDAGFSLASVLERADAADAFVSSIAEGVDGLPPGARVATSSLRRQLQLKAIRPDLVFVEVRGNVNTRLAKLDRGEFEAMILACAGLDRLGLGARIRSRLASPAWLPAVGQGALAAEYRDGDDQVGALVASLVHAPTATCCAAERAMNAVLEGSCNIPIAAYAELRDGQLTLRGAVGDPASGTVLRAESEGRERDPEALGRLVAGALLDAGAGEILSRQRSA
jgi:hydroxymethylbilane synthase